MLKLAEALHPLLDKSLSTAFVTSKFDEIYSAKYLDTLARKLGFITPATPTKSTLSDAEYSCIQTLFEVLKECSSDMTNTFRALAGISRSVEVTQADKDAIERLVKLSAPVEQIAAQKKPKYTPAAIEKIKSILETNPGVLAMFGMDPDDARREIAASEEALKFKSVS